MFHRFSPLVEGLGFEVRKKNALKIGQKVMRDDLHPLAEGWKVVAKDFWVLAEGSEEVVKDFWVPAEGSGIIANDFRPIVLNCFLLERQDEASPSLAGFGPCGKQSRLRSRVWYISLFHF